MLTKGKALGRDTDNTEIEKTENRESTFLIPT